MTGEWTPRWRTSFSIGFAIAVAFGTTLLATDNVLGLLGGHVLGSGSGPVVAVLTTLAGVGSIVFALIARDLVRGIAAVVFLGFVLTQSPALASEVWLPIRIALQVGVPLGIGACAMLVRRRAARTPWRAVSVISAVLAAVWMVGAFVPVPLELFLVVQVATLLSLTVLLAAPWIRSGIELLQELSDSAAIR